MRRGSWGQEVTATIDTPDVLKKLLLKGSWDLVITAIIRVTILITYNHLKPPTKVLTTILTSYKVLYDPLSGDGGRAYGRAASSAGRGHHGHAPGVHQPGHGS